MSDQHKEAAAAAIEKLTAIKNEAYRDPETAHGEADDVLLDVLRELGLDAVARAWEAIEPKWYA
jgi:hypothetical protein